MNRHKTEHLPNHAARLHNAGYSSPRGRVHNTKITTRPKCAYNEMLMDSVSIGHVTFSFNTDTVNDPPHKDYK